MWYMYALICYWTFKKNKTKSFLEMWMATESVSQGEMSEREKQILYINE